MEITLGVSKSVDDTGVAYPNATMMFLVTTVNFLIISLKTPLLNE